MRDAKSNHLPLHTSYLSLQQTLLLLEVAPHLPTTDPQYPCYGSLILFLLYTCRHTKSDQQGSLKHIQHLYELNAGYEKLGNSLQAVIYTGMWVSSSWCGVCHRYVKWHMKTSGGRIQVKNIDIWGSIYAVFVTYLLGFEVNACISFTPLIKYIDLSSASVKHNFPSGTER